MAGDVVGERRWLSGPVDAGCEAVFEVGDETLLLLPALGQHAESDTPSSGTETGQRMRTTARTEATARSAAQQPHPSLRRSRALAGPSAG
eukprot:331655-Rhodomonas_salina.1